MWSQTKRMVSLVIGCGEGKEKTQLLLIYVIPYNAFTFKTGDKKTV